MCLTYLHPHLHHTNGEVTATPCLDWAKFWHTRITRDKPDAPHVEKLARLLANDLPPGMMVEHAEHVRLDADEKGDA